MISYNTAVVLIGTSLLGACSGLVGCFAVLRRRALTGDALAHAALPGLCIAFLIVQERSLPALLAGALASGIVGVMTISGLRFSTRIKEDAAIGIVLSVFFGLGIVLSRLIQNRSSTGSKAGLDSYIFGKTAGMIAEDVYVVGGVTLACLLLLLVLYKEFQLVAFDPDFAEVQGWPSYWIDLALMTMVALTVIVGLPAVGVVMIAALLIIPATSARFWTNHLGTLLAMSAAAGIVAAFSGTLLSARYDVPAGPSIVLVAAALFFVSVLFAPRRGVIAQAISRVRLRRHLAEQATLQAFFELLEGRDAPQALSFTEIHSVRRARRKDLVRDLRRLVNNNLVRVGSDARYQLTPAGIDAAVAAARDERLRLVLLEQHADLALSLTLDETEPIDALIPDPLVRELEGKLCDAGRLPSAAHWRNRDRGQR